MNTLTTFSILSKETGNVLSTSHSFTGNPSFSFNCEFNTLSKKEPVIMTEWKEGDSEVKTIRRSWVK